MNKRVAVAVINHNTRNWLRACLASTVREAPAEIIVVDNASTDGSAGMVRAEFPSVTLLADGSNPGYGQAANQAIGACRPPFILLLNSDTLIRPGALQALVDYAIGHPLAAVIGPRLLNVDGTLQPSCFNFPTPADVFLDVTHLGRLARRVPAWRERYLRTWSHSAARPVPWVSGAALLLQRAPFEAAGGFDPSFFMYYEEVDLCYRLQRMGWQVHFAPVADIAHAGGASTRLRRADMAVQLYAGLAHFYRKHYSMADLFQLSVLLECVALARWVRDAILLRVARDGEERARLVANLNAWRRLLRGQWRRPVAQG